MLHPCLRVHCQCNMPPPQRPSASTSALCLSQPRVSTSSQQVLPKQNTHTGQTAGDLDPFVTPKKPTCCCNWYCGREGGGIATSNQTATAAMASRRPRDRPNMFQVSLPKHWQKGTVLWILNCGFTLDKPTKGPTGRLRACLQKPVAESPGKPVENTLTF